jgi:hypothetical protein
MTNGRHDPETHANIAMIHEDHLSEGMQRRYIAALFHGAAEDPAWLYATEHLAACTSCVDGAMRCAQEICDSPDLRLLVPGEFALHAQRVWIKRLRQHPRAAMREAAAHELGNLEAIGPAGYSALVDAALRDPDSSVRAAAEDALAAAFAREPVGAQVRRWAGAEA